MKPVEIAKEALTTKSEPVPKVIDGLLSTSVTLLDLGISGRTRGALIPGKMYHFAGRQGAGKTFLTRGIMAEACLMPFYDNYDLVYDDVEYGALMDTAKFYGMKLVKRLVPPAWSKKKTPIYSSTLGDFYTRIKKRLALVEAKKLKPFIWIEDSLDSLDSDNTTKMTDNKAKQNSQELRRLLQPLAETKSILILISQARADLKSMFGGDLVAGGRALEHYPSVSVWLRRAGAMTKTHEGKKYKIGVRISASIKKNRVSGQDSTVFFPFQPTYGIDNIGANIDYLVSHKWKKNDQGIFVAEEFNYEGDRSGLIKRVERDNLQRELEILTGKIWKEIQKAITMERLPRYK